MRTPRQTLAIYILLPALLLCLFAAPSAAQNSSDSAQPATQEAAPATESAPASQPAETNPLPSPARMMQFFYDKVESDDPNRFDDALICLNFDQVDEDVRRERAGDYLRMLVEILQRIEEQDYYERGSLPDEPTAPTQTIGKDPLLLTIEREPESPDRTVRRWQFSATTVKDIPETHGKLEQLARLSTVDTPAPLPVEPVTPGDEPPAQANELRSPYHMMQYFLVKVAEAERDTAAYTAAMQCVDFSLVDPQVVEEHGAEYVDNLATIIAYLREGKDKFDREQLPKEPAADVDTITIGSESFLIHVVRQAGDQWRISAATVKRVPEMMAALDAAKRKAVEEGETAAVTTAARTSLRLDTSSAQATMNLFLTAMADNDIPTALRCMDLSDLSRTQRELAGTLAGKLLLVLNRHALIVVQDVPDTPERREPYTLLKQPAGRIEIDRKRTGEREGEWLFSAATVRSVESLYAAFEKRPIIPELQGSRISFWKFPALYVREYMVPASFKTPLLGLQSWQWIAIGLILLAGLILRIVSVFALPSLLRRLLATQETAILPAVLRKAIRPTTTLLMFAAWWLGIQLLDLNSTILSWTWFVLKIVMSVLAVYAIYRLISIVGAYFSGRAARSQSRLEQVLIPLLEKTARVVVVALGGVYLANAFGAEIGPLIAGLGVGGLAFGLAAQDTLKNFFGSVNVVLDRPFQVGDWIKMGDTEGTVESVGLRSTRIRTFYNSEVTVPNSQIMNAQVDNLGRRRWRRISTHLSVTYDTPPEKLEAFCEGIRVLIRKHPYTRKDYYHVWVNRFGASSIDILLYCFHDTPEWGTELRERHRLFLDIVRLAQRLGVEFAFPTQTVHLHHDSNPPAETPPPPASPPSDGEGAQRFGGEQAERIVHESFGETVEKPPPVEY